MTAGAGRDDETPGSRRPAERPSSYPEHLDDTVVRVPTGSAEVNEETVVRVPEVDEDTLERPGGKRARKQRGPVVSFLRETAIVVVAALIISLVVKTFFIQAFYVPSESMETTLMVDDKFVVNKLRPGPMDLRRGDIVVFEDPGGWLRGAPPELTPAQQVLTWIGLLPQNAGHHLVKRVIGLPGDQVACCDAEGRVTVNGVGIDEPYLMAGSVPSQIDFSVTVPADHLWVMGDNRSRSADSRYNGGAVGGGFVPIDNVVGTAFLIVYPLDRFGTLPNPHDTFAKVPDPPTP